MFRMGNYLDDLNEEFTYMQIAMTIKLPSIFVPNYIGSWLSLANKHISFGSIVNPHLFFTCRKVLYCHLGHTEEDYLVSQHILVVEMGSLRYLCSLEQQS